jgi:starch synthase
VDDLLAANYSPTDLSGKAVCRARLVEAFGLAPDERPVIAVISRLLDRKGFDLIKGAIDQLLDLPLKMVFMGRGEDKYHVLLNDLAAAHPGRIGVQVDFDKRLAHEIMAGSDIFLMPSRYEPCGLEQLYGLKYGAVPVVRATGGLDDTVIDVEAHPEAGTGFKFEEYTPQALVEAVDRATRCFKDRPAWEALMRRGMDVNYSWAKAAAEYEKIYQAALERVREKPVQKSGEQ